MSCIRLRSFAASTGNYLYGNGHIRQCYDFISSPCDPWQRCVLSAPFYAQPIKPFYTITYISSHLSIFHSFLLPPPYMIHGAGWCSDSPALWCAPHPSPNPQFSWAIPNRRAARLIVFISHKFYAVRVRDQGWNAALLPSSFCHITNMME